MEKYVIFDADNTLWQIEPIYDEARQRMVSLVSQLTGIEGAKIDSYQRDTDAKLYQIYGYSKERFPESFRRTGLNFLSDCQVSDYLEHIVDLGRSVFRSEVPITDGVEQALLSVKQVAKIALFTSGEEEEQKRKLSLFPYTHFFEDRIEIVEKKNRFAFQVLCEKWDIDVENSWMVGDSLKSDIYPALEIGLNTILFKANNWHEVETKGFEISPIVKVIDDLGAIPDLVSFSNLGG